MYQVKFNGGGQGISRVANKLPYVLYSKRRRARALINTFTQTHPPTTPTQLNGLTDVELENAGNTYFFTEPARNRDGIAVEAIPSEWNILYRDVFNLADIRDDLNDLLIEICRMGALYALMISDEYARRYQLNQLTVYEDERIKYYILYLEFQIRIMERRHNLDEERRLTVFLGDARRLQAERVRNRSHPSQWPAEVVSGMLNEASSDESNVDTFSVKKTLLADGTIKLEDTRKPYTQQLSEIRLKLQDPNLSREKEEILNIYYNELLEKQAKSHEVMILESEANLRSHAALGQLNIMNQANEASPNFIPSLPPPPPPENLGYEGDDESGRGRGGNIKNKHNATKSRYKNKLRRNKSRINRNKSRRKNKSRRNKSFKN